MEKIVKNIKIENSVNDVFQKFVQDISSWWPKEYTWSQKKLTEMKIDAKKNGLCSEIGPYGFRCDWGRVVALKANKQIEFKWQISPKREPVPDPENSSDIKVDFFKDGTLSTKLNFTHYNFEKHGEEAENYKTIMDSDKGWDFILNRFKTFCEKG